MKTPYDLATAKMKPPLRGPVATLAAVLEGIRTGAIDAIATDHAPHPGSEKMAGVRELPVRDSRLEQRRLGIALGATSSTRGNQG